MQKRAKERNVLIIVHGWHTCPAGKQQTPMLSSTPGRVGKKFVNPPSKWGISRKTVVGLPLKYLSTRSSISMSLNYNNAAFPLQILMNLLDNCLKGVQKHLLLHRQDTL
eukprot:250479-Pelagomonas_calceolata.AAC.1